MPFGVLGEKKYTEYKLNGEPITLCKKRGRPVKYRNPEYISQEKKVEVAALYTVLGDIAKTSKLTGVTEKQIRDMREEPWWADVQKQIMVEENEKLLGTINETVAKALINLQDRIENGDLEIIPERPAVLDKDGNVISEAVPAKHLRKPIKARDLSQIFHALTHQRQLMNGDPTAITKESTTEQKLALLQKHFREFSQGVVIEGTATEIEDKSEPNG